MTETVQADGARFWLLKTEPDEYSYDDLERDGKAVWDGVSNNAALKYMRAVAPGDTALIYHTGDERAAVGLAEITSAAYPDPQQQDAKLVVFDLRPLQRLPRRVTLAEIKADSAFAGFDLVRLPRLSVMPVPDHYWRRLIELGSQ
jgi:predicted RNA-binding protein with PUA-like domain